MKTLESEERKVAIRIITGKSYKNDCSVFISLEAVMVDHSTSLHLPPHSFLPFLVLHPYSFFFWSIFYLNTLFDYDLNSVLSSLQRFCIQKRKLEPIPLDKIMLEIL